MYSYFEKPNSFLYDETNQPFRPKIKFINDDKFELIYTDSRICFTIFSIIYITFIVCLIIMVITLFNSFFKNFTLIVSLIFFFIIY